MKIIVVEGTGGGFLTLSVVPSLPPKVLIVLGHDYIDEVLDTFEIPVQALIDMGVHNAAPKETTE